MTESPETSKARREFLKFLAASPYVAALGGVSVFLERRVFAQDTQQTLDVIKSPAEALDVLDFEEAAHRKVMAGHWAYMSSGVDDDGTLHANRDGYKHVQLRPRRLRDATKVDMRVELFGTVYDSPIFICPTSGGKAFHPDGELAVALAAKARGTLQFLSTATSVPIEEINKALGRPVWQQLYAPSSWDACEKLLRRFEAAGCSVIALTVDNTTGRNSETFFRTRPKDLSKCTTCHESAAGPSPKERPMYDGIDMSNVHNLDPAMDWAFVDRLRKYWKGKFLIKGIDTREDAALCVEHGVDGIVVSNHGGRSTETLRATIEALPEVVAEVKNRVPVFVDGGVRRGTDVFKALALGAKGVGIGRPYLWGLGAFGQPGVDRVLEILQGELKLVMGNCGTRTVADISRAYVATPDWKI
ncbi:MAG: alpha-hydroxy acid oxidase [Candidatus Acidiferrales bacterium]|jgi:isopentenyl diphosphate isomerase/L-lactate dehydrogenase-like FMN-dependent dehydrogenase